MVERSSGTKHIIHSRHLGRIPTPNRLVERSSVIKHIIHSRHLGRIPMASGDGDGRLFFWDFKTGGKVETFKAHDKVSITLDWHPLLASRVCTGSWDGKVKIWD